MVWVKKEMEHARRQRELLQMQDRENTDKPSIFMADRRAATSTSAITSTWLLSAAAAWVVTIVLAWMAGSNSTTTGIGTTGLITAGANPASEVTELEAYAVTSMELRDHIDDLNGRITQLTDSIANIETGLTRVFVMMDAMPSTASGPAPAATRQNDLATIEKPAIKKPAIEIPVIAKTEPAAPTKPDTVAVAVADTTLLPPATEIIEKSRPAGADNTATPATHPVTTANTVKTTTTPHWYINLASLPSKADADKYASRARSKDIQVEQHAVTIKGKDYWRVQAGGFASAGEARAQAETIKAKLGLKEVWISKH